MNSEQETGRQAVTKAKTKRPTAVHVEPVYTSVDGAKALTGWGGTTIWGLIKAGELRVVRLGQRGKYAGRTTIEVASIHEAIARRSVKAA